VLCTNRPRPSYAAAAPLTSPREPDDQNPSQHCMTDICLATRHAHRAPAAIILLFDRWPCTLPAMLRPATASRWTVCLCHLSCPLPKALTNVSTTAPSHTLLSHRPSSCNSTLPPTLTGTQHELLSAVGRQNRSSRGGLLLPCIKGAAKNHAVANLPPLLMCAINRGLSQQPADPPPPSPWPLHTRAVPSCARVQHDQHIS
jgi:hypothetical protein